MATTLTREEQKYDAFIVDTTHSHALWKHGL